MYPVSNTFNIYPEKLICEWQSNVHPGLMNKIFSADDQLVVQETDHFEQAIHSVFIE